MTNHISLEREYQKISSTGILSEISFNTTHPEFERLYNNSKFLPLLFVGMKGPITHLVWIQREEIWPKNFSPNQGKFSDQTNLGISWVHPLFCEEHYFETSMLNRFIITNYTYIVYPSYRQICAPLSESSSVIFERAAYISNEVLTYGILHTYNWRDSNHVIQDLGSLPLHLPHLWHPPFSFEFICT